MKKISFLFTFLFIVTVGFFTSCDFTTYGDPEIEIVATPDTVPAGEETDVVFNITLTPDILNNVSITDLTIEEWGIVLDSVHFTQVAQSVTYSYTYTVPADFEDEEVLLTVYVWDDYHDSPFAEYGSVVIDGEAAPTIITYNNVTFNADANSFSYNHIFDASTGDVYPTNHTPIEDFDIAYMYHGEWDYFVASPDAWAVSQVFDLAGLSYTTSDKNTTHIQRVTSISSLSEVDAEFLDNFTIEQDSYVAGSSDTGIGCLVEEGDFVGFITEDGYKGVFEVKELTYISSKAAETSMIADFVVLSASSSAK